MTPREAFADQARSCRALGSELTARVAEGLGIALEPDQGRVAQAILNWPGEPSSRGDSVPLRVAGALHAMVRRGMAPELARAYAQGEAPPAVMIAALQAHEDFVLDWLKSPPQTNEVGRSTAIIAAAHFLRPALPLSVLELGASAGLNLNWHRYRLEPQDSTAAFGPKDSPVTLRPDWRGTPPAPAPICVAAAEGIDLNPLNAATDGERLLAYCWPDQTERLSRLEAALTLARQFPPQVAAGDAADWLEMRLIGRAQGQMRFVYHTVAWQYFPPETQTRCEAALQDAGARARADSPLVHFAMEADGGKAAGLRLRVWDGGMREWQLGRADFHGRWIDWQPELL